MSTQKSSICKHHAAADGNACRTCCGGLSRRGRGGGNHKRRHENQRNHDPKITKYYVLAKSVATLSKNVNMMAAHMSGKSDDNDDAKPNTDGKKGLNTKISTLCKATKREKE